MKPALVDNLMAALNALIVDELAGTAPGRFVTIAKLCGQADKIRQMCAVRVKDVTLGPRDELAINADDDLGDDNGYIGAPGYDRPLLPMLGGLPRLPRGLGLGGGHVDGTDIFRTVIDMVQPLLKRLTDAPKNPTAQLDQLLVTRAGLVERAGDNDHRLAQLDALDGMIDDLMAQIAKEKSNEHDDSPVVPSDVLRRREAGGDERDLVLGDHDRTDDERAPGGQESRGDGSQEGLDREAGHVDDQRREQPASADRQGGQAPGEAPQARADADHGGEVLRREDGGAPRDLAAGSRGPVCCEAHRHGWHGIDCSGS